MLNAFNDISMRWIHAFSNRIVGESLLDIYGHKNIFKLWHHLDDKLTFTLFSKAKFDYLLEYFCDFGEINPIDDLGLLNTPCSWGGKLPMNVLIENNPKFVSKILKMKQYQSFPTASNRLPLRFNLKSVRDVLFDFGDKVIFANIPYYLKKFNEVGKSEFADQFYEYLKNPEKRCSDFVNILTLDVREDE